MSGASQTSDRDVVERLRQAGSMCIAELAAATAVTPTAVRQRLTRLMRQGLVERHTLPGGRGRPSHRYLLTEKGQRQSGSNFVDLAMMLWQEIRSISDPAVRRGLIGRLAKRMAGMYADRVEGKSPEGKMQAVASVFGDRDVPVAVEMVPAPALQARVKQQPLPVIDLAATKEAAGGQQKIHPTGGQAAVLTVWACPYPELAEVDRGICAMERLMFAELLEADVRLTACRLDGDPCCRFQTGPLAVSNAVASG